MEVRDMDGTPAFKIKKSIQDAFGNIVINCHAGKIEVAWLKMGKKRSFGQKKIISWYCQKFEDM